MKFSVSQAAANWYIDELGLKTGDHLRIFTKIYSGIPTVYPGYYLGISIGASDDAHFKTTVNGITFYIPYNDDWILNEYDLRIDLKDDEAQYNFTEAN